MAIPKVFVSSTCFDLGEVRDQLKKLIESFGFDPVLSEYGDVFYHPDLHTHDACIQEVSHCQLFILIIGGRFGGEYQADKSKSITNAEYLAAKESNIPIFTYIKKDVLHSQFLYKQNKDQKFVGDINYPAIDKQEHALDIFTFMNDVQKADKNNGVEGFENFQDIGSHLKKQWAGMFFDFLKTREVKSQIDATNHLLSGLQQSHEQVEELIKSLYISVKPNEAEKNIELLEYKNEIEEWFRRLFGINIEGLGNIDLTKINIDSISAISPKDLDIKEYFLKTNLYEEYEVNNTKVLKPLFYKSDYTPYMISHFIQTTTDVYNTEIKDTSEEFRHEIIEKIFSKHPEIDI